MSARKFGGQWLVECDGITECCDVLHQCPAYRLDDTLLLATAAATRAGWVTRSVTVDIDGVPRQRVEHYCPAHKGVAG